MGTMIYSRGLYGNRCFDERNRSSPALISDIHEDYVEAGTRHIETNTGGAERFKLQSHRVLEKPTTINEAGAQLGPRPDVLVAGPMSPFGIRLQLFGPVDEKEAVDAFCEQAESLASAGMDLFIPETFSDLHEIACGVLAIRNIRDCPAIGGPASGTPSS